MTAGMKMRTFIGRIRIGRIHRRFAGMVIALALISEVVFWRVFVANDADIVLQIYGASAVCQNDVFLRTIISLALAFQTCYFSGKQLIFSEKKPH